MMKCTTLTGAITILGSRRSVNIGPAWQGDVDELVSDGLTVADALGPELITHFAPLEGESEPAIEAPADDGAAPAQE